MRLGLLSRWRLRVGDVWTIDIRTNVRIVKHVRASHLGRASPVGELVEKTQKISQIAKVRHGDDTSQFASHFEGWEVRHPELRTIGQRLAYIRAQSGESQTEIAERVGVALRTWQNYEQDKRQPDAEALVSLFRLGWSPTWVLTGMEPLLGAGLGTSQDLSGEALMVSHELAEEALRGLWLPKHRFFDLAALIYAGVTQGLPYAEIIDFARSEASKLAKERTSDDGEQGVGGTGAGRPGGSETKAPGAGDR